MYDNFSDWYYPPKFNRRRQIQHTEFAAHPPILLFWGLIISVSYVIFPLYCGYILEKFMFTWHSQCRTLVKRQYWSTIQANIITLVTSVLVQILYAVEIWCHDLTSQVYYSLSSKWILQVWNVWWSWLYVLLYWQMKLFFSMISVIIIRFMVKGFYWYSFWVTL